MLAMLGIYSTETVRTDYTSLTFEQSLIDKIQEVDALFNHLLDKIKTLKAHQDYKKVFQNDMEPSAVSYGSVASSSVAP